MFLLIRRVAVGQVSVRSRTETQSLHAFHGMKVRDGLSSEGGRARPVRIYLQSHVPCLSFRVCPNLFPVERKLPFMETKRSGPFAMRVCHVHFEWLLLFLFYEDIERDFGFTGRLEHTEGPGVIIAVAIIEAKAM